MHKPDILTALRPEQDLHPQFIALRDSPQLAPARGILREIFADFTDPDGNFVEQFQTTGFDARTFELYLFAIFKEANFNIDRTHTRPDFLLKKDGQAVCVESVTANPPPAGIIPYHPFPKDRESDDWEEMLRNDIPIRFGSPLFSKLNKRYWELPHVAGHPFVIAIQSFHEDGALMISSAPLTQYLYGLSSHWYHDANGELIISTRPIDTHKAGAKEIPSGFFAQPRTENISAVLFSNSGTMSKFNRIGHEGAYHSDSVRLLRAGTRYQFNPNANLPAPFLYEVGNGEDPETWREGSVLIHNPQALYPIPSGFFGAAAEDNLVGDHIVTTFAEQFHPLSSLTRHYPGDTPTVVLQEVADSIMGELLQYFPPPMDLD